MVNIANSPSRYEDNKLQLEIRISHTSDVANLCELLNEIIRIGGSTGMETTLSAEEFTDIFLTGPQHICCFVAVDRNGMLWGFQQLEQNAKLSDSCADIATFARHKPKKRGVGTALFAETRKFAVLEGYESIKATIRADNTSGLSYYSKMGFRDHSTKKNVPLNDGTLVDRISKRFTLK